jgi:hypothetical protein
MYRLQNVSALNVSGTKLIGYKHTGYKKLSARKHIGNKTFRRQKILATNEKVRKCIANNMCWQQNGLDDQTYRLQNEAAKQDLWWVSAAF